MAFQIGADPSNLYTIPVDADSESYVIEGPDQGAVKRALDGTAHVYKQRIKLRWRVAFPGMSLNDANMLMSEVMYNEKLHWYDHTGGPWSVRAVSRQLEPTRGAVGHWTVRLELEEL